MRVIGLAAAVALTIGMPAVSQELSAPLVFEELIYKPIIPCRAFDTRTKSPVPSKGTVVFEIAGPGSLQTQGGPAKGCGVPLYAKAVQLALSATDAIAAGYAFAYPADQRRPASYGTVYAKGALASAASTTLLGGPGPGYGRVAVYATRQTHVIGDVNGYYAPKIEGTFSSDGTIRSATSRIVSTVRKDIGYYQVFLDLDASKCRAVAQPLSSSVTATAVALGSGVFVTARHAQTGEPSNTAFHLLVSC